MFEAQPLPGEVRNTMALRRVKWVTNLGPQRFLACIKKAKHKSKWPGQG